jgi:RHS repeat-associated protein
MPRGMCCPDALGSVRAVTDQAKAIRTRYQYEPYGETLTTGDASTNSYQYTGRENDGAGLYYYRARYYHPRLKRFVSEDPIGYEAGINFYAYAYAYAYVDGDPIKKTDPTGEAPEDCMSAFPNCKKCRAVAQKCTEEHSDPVQCLEKGERPGPSVDARIKTTCVLSQPDCMGCFDAIIRCALSVVPKPPSYNPGKP